MVCFVTGLSHIAQPRAWAELFSEWRAKGNVGVFYAGLLHFNFGALIVAGREIQPSGLSLMLQGIILFMVISSDVLLRYKVRLVRK